MFKGIIKFISEARTELIKVTWPTRQQAINLTLTVLGVSLIFALYIAGVDFILTESVKWISGLGVQNQIQVPSTQIPVNGDIPEINLGDVNVETTPAN
ncbi:MAG: preprotein translocase subunit SecE [Patescibacteria group bacterium]